MLEIMKPINKTPTRKGQHRDRNYTTTNTQETSIDRDSIGIDPNSPFNESKSDHDPTGALNPPKTQQIPVTMFADFIESGNVGDIDIFLTRVSQMPAASQNKMLQEKLLLLNEKLSNVFEEITSVKKFHQKLSKFFKVLRNKIEEHRQIEAERKMLDDGMELDVQGDFDKERSRDRSDLSIFAKGFGTKVDNFAQKALRELDQYDIFFKQLLSNPSVKATFQSEVSRLNDLKNCEYHRSKIKQLLDDYHGCVEENLRLKEINLKLSTGKKALETKHELVAKKL